MDAKNECVRTFSCQIPWEEVRETRKVVVKRLGRKTTVRGFRKGRAPASMLTKHFQSEVVRAVLECLGPKHLSAEVESLGLKVMYGPKIDKVEFNEGRPMVVHATCEVWPEFELGEYRKLRVAYQAPIVGDGMVDGYLERLRQRHASFLNIDPRPIRSGDYVLVAMVIAEQDGTALLTNPQFVVHVGAADNLEPFNRNLDGMSPGERCEFDAQWPSGHPDPKLAGKELHCRLEVQSVMERELPDIDDEFAQDVDSKYETLAQLRTDVEEHLHAGLQQTAVNTVREQVMRQLVRNHQFALPPTYVEQRTKAYLEGNADKEREGGTGASLTTLVENRVRLEMVLDRIAGLEGLSVADSELEKLIQPVAEQHQVTVERARRELSKNGVLDDWKVQMLRDKALGLIVDETQKVPLMPGSVVRVERAKPALAADAENPG